jgi:hypothetical protein
VNHFTFAYRTRPRVPGSREIRRMLLTDSISQVHADSRDTNGYRRVHATLRIEWNLVVNHKLVAGLMADVGVWGLPPRKSCKRHLVTVRTTSDLVNCLAPGQQLVRAIGVNMEVA